MSPVSESQDPVVGRLLSALAAVDASECPAPEQAYERFEARRDEVSARLRLRNDRGTQSVSRSASSWQFRQLVILATLIAAVGVAMYRAAPVGPKPYTARVYITRAAQHANITLPDGSQVLLGDASTLQVDPAYGTDNRRVTLVGTAQFTVNHTNGIPMSVQAGSVEVRVLGTTFGVRRYREDMVTQVVVRDGRVALARLGRGRRAAAVLAANTVGELGDSGAVAITPNVAPEEYLQWTAGHLAFHDTPLDRALRDIGRRYDVDIRCTDSALARRTFTTTITTESISEVLDMLVVTLGVDYTRSGPGGRMITLVPNGRVLRRVPLRPTSTVEVQYGR